MYVTPWCVWNVWNIANLSDLNKDMVILKRRKCRRWNQTMQPRQEIDCPEFSEESIIAHRRLGLFDRGRKRPLKLALMNK